MIVERDVNSVLVAAKKVDDAIKEGLETLGATLDEVKVDVVESGGIFRKAKVRLTLEKDETAAPASEPVKAEKTEKAEKPEKSEKAEKSVKEEKPAKEEKVEKVEKADKAEKVEKPEEVKPEKAEEVKPAAKADAPVKKAEKEVKPLPKSQAPKRKDGAETEQSKESRKAENREAEAAALGRAYEFVKELVAKMGFQVRVEQDPTDPELIKIEAEAGDDSLIIGRHGETLAALSYLAETGARAEKCRVSVTVDCNGYRDRRAASLAAMARRRADEAVNKGRRIKLEPMERIDRRTIHNALTDDDRVSTASEGKEPYRFVVIIPSDERKGGHNGRRGGRDRRDRDRSRAEKPADGPAQTEPVSTEEE